MVKGLFARETNRILPNRDVRWKFGYLRPDGEKDVWLPRELNLHDVVKVRWGQAEEDPFVSVWVISIYSEHSFTVSTSPAARLLHNRKSGMKPMIWPGPNA